MTRSSGGTSKSHCASCSNPERSSPCRKRLELTQVNRLPPKPLELVLPDELQDSLRRLRPEGNLLRERFRSAVIRGRVEPRKPVVQPRKPKRYIVEKWSYRDFPIVT